MVKILKVTLVSLLLVSFSINIYAIEPEYKADSKTLTIPKIKIGDGFVYDAKLKLNDAGSFDIVGYSENSLPENLASENSMPREDAVEKCTDKHLSIEKSNQIIEGMTLKQVYGILSCKEESFISGSGTSIYFWENDEAQMQVMFEDKVVSIAIFISK